MPGSIVGDVTDRIDTLIILGANGDLTSRLLLPGLSSLLASTRGSLINLVGVDRGELSQTDWRAKVTQAFAATPSSLGTAIAKESRYLQADVTS